MPPLISDEDPGAVSRRGFLQLLGGIAAAGLEGCFRAPAGEIVPYVRTPEGAVPGNPLHYATALSLDGFALGVVATSYEGRPVKIEGNPLHPESLGATRIFEQASLFQLYDPARARDALERGEPRAWRTFLDATGKRARELRSRRGAGLWFLLEPGASPTIAALRARLQEALPECRLRSWSALAPDAASAGARIAFGRPLEARIAPARAEVIAVLDDDFAQDHVREARELADRRVPGPQLCRLYVAEARPSATGTLADHRLPIRAGRIEALAVALVKTLADRLPSPPELRALRVSVGPEEARWVQALAADLASRPGAGLVVAGRRQPPAVHAAAHAVNALLGNLGASVTFRAPLLHDPLAGRAVIAELAAAMAAGAVDTLVVSAYNPCFGAPPELDFAAKLLQVPFSVYLGARADETAAAATWFLPAAHPFETWGDARGSDGTASIVQPLLAPLFGGVSEVDLLAAFLGDPRPAHEIVRATWSASRPAPDFGAFWQRSLQRGVVDGTATPEVRPEPRWDAIAGALHAAAPAASGPIELDLYPDAKVFDGRFAPNRWLQELPDPVTKQTWGNAALLAPATAQRLGIGTGDHLRLVVGAQVVTVPALLLPGTAEDAVALALGYGGSEAPADHRGGDGYRLRGRGQDWIVPGVRVEPAGGREELAITQGHFRLEGRDLARQVTVAELPSLGGVEVPLSIYPPVDYPGHRWGLSIDLARCTGCSACVMACASENNTPVVGHAEVVLGREMHWLRIDRYLEGPDAAPEAITMPLMCVHCEDAPCEYVCPVNATVHSDEGLNEMIYNRCVGTRYCSNNCPYKVRRFNFLDWGYQKGPVLRMLQNPDVTVRSRGVMEKCTYCVQRIERARIDAQVSGRTLRDGDIRTACQQACPTRAIVFGDLADAGSEVSRLHRDRRAYALLGELGTRPRTLHLARVKNPNPALAEG